MRHILQFDVDGYEMKIIQSTTTVHNQRRRQRFVISLRHNRHHCKHFYPIRRWRLCIMNSVTVFTHYSRVHPFSVCRVPVQPWTLSKLQVINLNRLHAIRCFCRLNLDIW
ncbi:hypothetical protein ACHAWU_001337 [Discostella pseudostelligera]|uniref:Methyltransferase FkbM domain-containing protein n=1 Tax=Discostella pseudostelligera TaxID=259834 RepID=A0ABD3M733_9STRA